MAPPLTLPRLIRRYATKKLRGGSRIILAGGCVMAMPASYFGILIRAVATSQPSPGSASVKLLCFK